ncbi:hypothetical protein Tco_0324389 [Tanacetum coccineum]
MNAPEKLTCRRTCQVQSHPQNSEEAGMSKDISGSELLAPSLCSGVEGQTDKGTVLVKDTVLGMTRTYVACHIYYGKRLFQQWSANAI